ncbi:hypothetical protein N9772_03430 [Bacteroidia bacterium]|nr:hypothetical protein [Bacteroidia bacterium]
MKRLILGMSLLITVTCFAQSIQIDDVKGRRFTGVKTILADDGETVSGYYTYYLVEKGSKGMRTLEFSIIDKGITKVTKTPIELHRSSTLNATVFNGKYFLISYDDRKNKQIVFTVIDLDGKVIAKNEISAAKRRVANSVVYPAANGEGFYIVRPALVKNRIKGHYLEKINNKLEEQWKIEDVVDKGIISVASLVNNKDRVVIWREHGSGIKKIKPQIVCYDAATGETVFERDGFDGESTIMHNQIRIDDANNVIVGGPYVDGEKYKTVNNTGIYLLSLTKDGEENFYTKIVTKEEIQPVLKSVSKGVTVGSKDKIWIEDVVFDGKNIIVISEMFRKNFNPKPAVYQKPRDLITGKWMGDMNYRDGNGKSPKVTFEIMDYILFKFSADGELDEIKPIAKEGYNKLTVYYPYVNLYGLQMAAAVERAGWFDYRFSTVAEDGKRLMVCSNNSQARKPQVFTYGLDDDFTKSEINLKQEAKVDLDKGRVSLFYVMPNEGQKIGVAYYQRKLKRITINLEDLN